MPLAARVGDAHTCPQKGHSVNSIASGSDNVFINGVPAPPALEIRPVVALQSLPVVQPFLLMASLPH